MLPGEITPKLVLCILGAQGSYERLLQTIQTQIDTVAPHFEIDTEYSENAPDDRMCRAFDVTWDRVYPGAWTDDDETAVENHDCVIYVLSQPMESGTHIEICMQALALIEPLFGQGMTALKGESAGISHGVNRWKELAAQAKATRDQMALSSICRIAFAKRPLSSNGWFESVGYHMVGIPEVFIDDELAGELELSHAMDAIADHIFQHGVDATLPLVQGELLSDTGHEEDAFKYNPYGIMWCRAMLPHISAQSAEVPKKKRFFGLFG
jgi:hypothetical protein